MPHTYFKTRLLCL